MTEEDRRLLRRIAASTTFLAIVAGVAVVASVASLVLATVGGRHGTVTHVTTIEVGTTP